MKILFAHQNFPGQFKHLCRHFVEEGGHELYFLTRDNQNRIPGVERLVYEPQREVTRGIHHYIAEYEKAILYGQACVRHVVALKDRGWKPDIMIGHNGWGETLFLKDVFPDVPMLSYFEFFYNSWDADCSFDPEYPMSFDDRLRVRVKNSTNLTGLVAADWGLSPTNWQRSRYPLEFQQKISVIHEGVNTDELVPDPTVTVTLADGRVLTRNDEVITYVSRNLEPYRGFHTVMRALPEILRRRPNAIVLMIGGDDVSYGRRLPEGETYKKKYLAEVNIDPSRVLFLGKIPYEQFVGVLRLSAVHVYLTYPFVLSWSMLEAMSLGCMVVGSRTPPVMEALEHEKTGLLVDFFSTTELADAVDRVLDHPTRMQHLRDAARQHIINTYDLKRICLPQTLTLIRELAARKRPTVGLWKPPVQMAAPAAAKPVILPASRSRVPANLRRGR
ncbi:MAG: glycosyltransferase family 4 protein [Alphaproteobacteria bacterium]|nr:glycosyltransferase family 4 protein [Alphaproteobacteria bacterium]